MTSSLNRVDEILALGKPRALICAIESASGTIALLKGAGGIEEFANSSSTTKLRSQRRLTLNLMQFRIHSSL